MTVAAKQTPSMEIPLVDLKAQNGPIRAELDAAVKAVFDSGEFILGGFLQRFEQECAKYLGVKHAIGVANGSDALYLALLALDIKPGDEVISVPHTYVATPESIVRTGAKLVFVDVEKDTWNMDIGQLKKAITKKTKAILPVHIFGQCANMTAINEIAGNIPVVEDAAQAWGADHWGAKSGALGTLSCFSFYPTKTLGACGDGGMVATDDDNLAARVRALRVHGESRRYFNNLHGVNSRLDGIQAAILSVKLKYVDGWNKERRHIAEYYRKRFEGSPVKLGVVADGNTHVWHQCVIMAPRRDELQAHLKSRGIGTNIFYPVPQHLQECFKDLGHKKGDFPVTESISTDSLALPVYPEMTEAQRKYVADEILAFYKK